MVILSEITHLTGNCLLSLLLSALYKVFVQLGSACNLDGSKWEMASIMGHIQILEMLNGGEKHTSKNGRNRII